MGIFSKIKDNLSHGGVAVSLIAPASVSMSNPVLPVTVNLVNNDQPRTVKSITAEILANSRDTAVDMLRNDTRNRMAQDNYVVDQVMAQSLLNEPFQLNSGETKTVTLNITLNLTANQQADGALGKIAGVIGKVNSFGAVFNQNHLTYSVRVTADIEGIALDPSADQPLQLV